MGVRVKWPRVQSEMGDDGPRHNSSTGGGTRTCGVEVAEVHVKALDSIGPTGEIGQLALRTGAHHPTGVDIRMIEGLGNRRKVMQGVGECACARDINLAVGQPPGDIGQNRPIPEQIASAHPRRAEPLYFCLVLEGRSPAHSAARRAARRKTRDGATDSKGRSTVLFFVGTLKVGLSPHNPYGGELPVEAGLTTTDEPGWVHFVEARAGKVGSEKQGVDGAADGGDSVSLIAGP